MTCKLCIETQPEMLSRNNLGFLCCSAPRPGGKNAIEKPLCTRNETALQCIRSGSVINHSGANRNVEARETVARNHARFVASIRARVAWLNQGSLA